MSEGKTAEIEAILSRTPLVQIVSQTVKLARKGRDQVGLCPFHSEKNPSFYVYSEGNHADDHFHCFGCNSHGDAIDFLTKAKGLQFQEAVQLLKSQAGMSNAKSNGHGDIVSTYDYTDETGNLLFQAVRFDPKRFKQRRPNGTGGWDWNIAGVRQVPFKLPELLKTQACATVFVCEGEKDVLNLHERGLIATTNAGGAGQWRDEHSAFLAGRKVIILEDNDKAGVERSIKVAKSLSSVAKAVAILKLPNLPDHGDVSDWLAAGGTAEELEELAERALRSADEAPQPEQLKQYGFTVLTPGDCEAGDHRPYVIKGLIARGDHVQFIGLPGSGKSALAPLAGYSIALGIPFLGRRVKQGRVLYLAAEDGHGMKLRIRALRRRFGDTPNFLLLPDAINLLDGEITDFDRVLKLVAEQKPVAVFIDTVSKAFPGLDENASEPMGKVVRVARTIAAEACRPAVVSIHHVAKDGGTTPRGHSVLNGDLDAVLLIQGAGAELRTIRMGKNRNGPSDATFAFNIETEDFGADEDGDPIMAPIAAPVEASADRGTAAKEARLSDGAALMLRELRDLVDRYGALVQPGGEHPTVRGVSRKLLRARLIDRGWFAENMVPKASRGEAELERAGYVAENHGLRGLKRKGFLSFNREYVWLT